MSLTFSPYHEVSETVALMADIGWTDWSAFDRNVVTVDGTGVTAEDFRRGHPRLDRADALEHGDAG